MRTALIALLASAVAHAQPNDAAYTAKIRQYTTETFFTTELVDHLPASDTVPTPEKVLGYVIGTPQKLTYTKDIYRYMRELEKATHAREGLHHRTVRRRPRDAAGRSLRRSQHRKARPLSRDQRPPGRSAQDVASRSQAD